MSHQKTILLPLNGVYSWAIAISAMDSACQPENINPWVMFLNGYVW